MYKLWLYRSSDNPVTIEANKHVYKGQFIEFYNVPDGGSIRDMYLVDAYRQNEIESFKYASRN